MRGQNAKSNTHAKIIFGSKYFLQKSHTYFCATKSFFLFEFIFCVVICVFCRTLEKIHGFFLLQFQTLLGKLLKDFICSIFISGAGKKTLGKSLKKEKNSTISNCQRGTHITTQRMNLNKKKFLVVQKYVCDFCKKYLDPKVIFTCVLLFAF